MMNNTLDLIAYCLRWLVWAVHYLVICPAGTLVLMAALLFCLDNTTPGAVAVDYLQKAGSITDGQRWTWRECTKQTPAELLPPPVYPDKSESLLQEVQEVCPEVVSDARGYAAYVNRSLLGILTWLWGMTGLAYGGLAWLSGHRPYYPHYAD